MLPCEYRNRLPRGLVRPGRLHAWLACWLAALSMAPSGCKALGSKNATPQAIANARQLTQQGINATERNDWKRAESLLSRAVETCALDADARRHYAETLWHRGATQEALVQIEEARRLASEDPTVAVRAGELYLAMNRISDASRMADEAAALDPKSAPAWALRGRVARASGQTHEALADFQRSLGYAPDDHEVGLLVAEAYRELNQPQRALIALESLSDNYPPGEEPQQILFLEGLALTALGRYDDAIGCLAQAARRDRPTSEILCRLAEAQLLSGRYAPAQASVQEALTLDPNHAGSRALSERLAIAAASGQTVRR